MKPKLLDLFSKAGGAGMGYARAGFEVVGLDIDPQPRYPFEHRTRDVFTLTPEEIRAEFDAIHASPECQGYTLMRHAPGAIGRPRMIQATRALLEATGLPWIIENVPGAHEDMPGAICLCGSMFGLGAQGHRLERHRLFMANFSVSAPGPCRHDKTVPVIGVYGAHARRRSAKHGGRGTRDPWTGGHRVAASEALGIDWMNLDELSEAIPPAFTQHLGAQLMQHLNSMREAA